MLFSVANFGEPEYLASLARVNLVLTSLFIVTHLGQKHKYRTTSKPAFFFGLGYPLTVYSRPFLTTFKWILVLFGILQFSAKWQDVTHSIDCGLTPISKLQIHFWSTSQGSIKLRVTQNKNHRRGEYSYDMPKVRFKLLVSANTC